MIQEEPQQFLPGITRGANDSDFDRFMFHRDATLKRESPAALGQRGFEIRFGLTLAELEAFASPRLAVLFTFFHAGIASEKTIRFKSGPKGSINPEQCAGN